MAQAEAEFPVPDPKLACPECDYQAKSPFDLGRHRFHRHGIAGKGGKAKGRKRRAPAAQAAPRAPSAKQVIAEVESSLVEAFTKGGAMLVPVLPVPGLYLVRTGDEAAAIIARMASRNPRLLAWLLKSSDAMDYFALGTWAAGLVVAVGVNFRRLPPDGTLARQWAIDEIVRELVENAEQAGAPVGTGDAEPGPVGDGAGAPSGDMGTGSALFDTRAD